MFPFFLESMGLVFGLRSCPFRYFDAPIFDLFSSVFVHSNDLRLQYFMFPIFHVSNNNLVRSGFSVCFQSPQNRFPRPFRSVPVFPYSNIGQNSNSSLFHSTDLY